MNENSRQVDSQLESQRAARALLVAAELAEEVLRQLRSGYVTTGFPAHTRVLAEAIQAYQEADPR